MTLKRDLVIMFVTKPSRNIRKRRNVTSVEVRESGLSSLYGLTELLNGG